MITGHTGFKGSWLALWLSQMGADITGYSLPPPTEPNHFDLLHLDVESFIGDVRNAEETHIIFKEKKPEIVFHLAAQPLVRESYQEPKLTFETNVLGTINPVEQIVAAARDAFGTPEIVIANGGGPPAMPAVEAWARWAVPKASLM